MTTLAIAPLYNSPGKRDATGAFQPEANAWIAANHDRGYTDWARILIDNDTPAISRRDAVLDAIREHQPDHVAFFCHGWKTGIQFGFGVQHTLLLAETLAAGFGPLDFEGETVQVIGPFVTLYACSTADGKDPGTGGDGGFADEFRDALCRAGATWCRVDAHTTAGHTTRNPYVRRFEGQGSAVGGTGGQWIVAPKSPLWSRWRKALAETDLRYRFPSMSVAEIHEELSR